MTVEGTRKERQALGLLLRCTCLTIPSLSPPFSWSHRFTMRHHPNARIVSLTILDVKKLAHNSCGRTHSIDVSAVGRKKVFGFSLIFLLLLSLPLSLLLWFLPSRLLLLSPHSSEHLALTLNLTLSVTLTLTITLTLILTLALSSRSSVAPHIKKSYPRLYCADFTSSHRPLRCKDTQVRIFTCTAHGPDRAKSYRLPLDILPPSSTQLESGRVESSQNYSGHATFTPTF